VGARRFTCAVALLLLPAGMLLAQEGGRPPLAELGRKLFFDPILSRDRSIACASCHQPEHAFADDAPVSTGVGAARGERNAPSVMNSTARLSFFWDGRAATLEEQALGPIENPVEMGLPLTQALERLNADAGYRTAFVAQFGSEASAKNLGKAIAAFEKTLETASSPYDRYAKGDDTAISAQARRGRLLFIGKAGCAECHSGEDFTADRYKNIGLYNAADLNDRGRGAITGKVADDGLFKTTSLRNVAMTAPYMHNGMFASLREVLEYYNDPDQRVRGARGRDAKLDRPLGLSAQDIADLEAFLCTLTDERFAVRPTACNNDRAQRPAS